MPERVEEHRIARRPPLLSWQDFHLSEVGVPEGNARVHLARPRSSLPGVEPGMLVRFPRGWARPGMGYYQADEEFLVVEGDLTVSGVTYRSGSYGWLPAGYPRYGSASDGGALAIARFCGPPRWISGRAEQDPRHEAVRIGHWQEAAERPFPFGWGPLGRLLRDGVRDSVWVLEGATAFGTVPKDCAVEMFSLADRTWTLVHPGQQPPPAGRTCFCRVIDIRPAPETGETR